MARRRGSLRLVFFMAPAVVLAVLTVGVFVHLHVEENYREQPIVQTVMPLIEAKDGQTFADSLFARIDGALSELGIEGGWVEKQHPDPAFEAPGKILVRVPSDLPLPICNLSVTRLVGGLGGKVYEAVEDGAAGEAVVMRVGLAGESAIHQVVLRSIRSISRKRGRIALILDDFGYHDLETAEHFCTLPQPLTLSVLPNGPDAQAISDLALRSNHEVILHLPMEPHTYPEDDPGEDAIFVAQSIEEIQKITERAMDLLPRAKGVNNHMGSRATEDLRVMEAVLTELKRRNYFFVDSRTSQRSIAYQTARALGVKTVRVMLFLDNERDSEAIRDRVLELSDLARKHGYAVGIGHNRLETFKVLEVMLPKLEKKGLRFVGISELVD